MNNFRLSELAIDRAAASVVELLAGGRLRIYAGARPASPDARIVGATLLAELVFGSPAFNAPAGGVAKARAITPESNAKATGRAAWFRALRRDGTPVFDGSVGTAKCDLLLDEVEIRAGAIVNVESLTYKQPRQA